MAPKQPRHAAQGPVTFNAPGAAMTEARGPKSEVPPQAKMIAGGFIAVLLAVLWIATSETAASAATAGMQRAFRIKDSAAELAANPNGGSPILVAKTNLQQGQPFLSIPAESVLDMRSLSEHAVGKMLQADNGTVINQLAQEHQITQGGFSIMNHAIFLALEKRKGSGSKWYSWLNAVAAPTASILFWPQETEVCMDRSIAAEGIQLQRTLNATVAAAAQLCESDFGAEAGCKGQPITEAEAKWAIGVYVQNNFQDQAIIPMVNFMAFDNTKPPAQPQFDQKTNTLNFNAGGPIARGSPITAQFLRGPQMLLAATGQFDAETARGVELALNFQQEDEAIQKICAPQVHEMQFGPNGKPRKGLVDCMFVLVADDKQKKKLLKNFRKGKTPVIEALAYGNLTVAASRMATEDGFNAAACDAAPESSLKTALKDWAAYRTKVLTANAQYLEQLMVQKYAAAGIPMPQPQQPAEEAQPDDAAAFGSASDEPEV